LLSHTQLFKQIPLFGGVDPAGPLVGVSPPQIKFYQANPPQGATFVCWPLPYSHCKHLHLVGWTLRARGWGEPPKMKFSKQTHTKERILFAGPRPIINPSGNFRRGHCAGYPWGLTFWVAPWLGALFHKSYII
jgi:hypothetical protein